MLFNFLAPLADQYSVFFLFSSLTFRAGGAVVTGLVVAFVFGPWIIGWLKQQQPTGQPKQSKKQLTARTLFSFMTHSDSQSTSQTSWQEKEDSLSIKANSKN